MKPMKLWLDDIRDPAEFGHIGWEWVKTAQEAIDCFRFNTITDASFDHDLAQFVEGKEESGYSVITWLEEHPHYWPIHGVKIHSMNPVGRMRMQAVIDKVERSVNVKA